MGNCFSDPSHSQKSKTSGGQKLGSAPGGQRLGGAPSTGASSGANGAGSGSVGRKFNDPPRPLGGSTLGGAGTGVGAGGAIGEEEQRERMLRAAEERVKASQSKGVTTSNPKSGQLSAKLAAERKKAASPSAAPNDERMMTLLVEIGRSGAGARWVSERRVGSGREDLHWDGIKQQRVGLELM